MFAQEVKIISITGKESSDCKRSENSPKIKLNKNVHIAQRTQHSHTANNAGRKKIHNHSNNTSSNNNSNTTHSYSAGNRKKFYHQNNNNNSTIKNQNICLTKNAHNLININNNNISNGNSNINNSSYHCTENISPSGGNVSAATTKTNYKNPLQVSMVMNSNSSNNTNLQSIAATSAVVSSSSSSITSTTSKSAPVSPKPYSLDFLHTICVPMTPGTLQRSCSNSNYHHSPSISPSHHVAGGGGTSNYGLNVPPPRHHRTNTYNQENSPLSLSDFNSNSNAPPRQGYKEYNSYDIPILIHHHHHHHHHQQHPQHSSVSTSSSSYHHSNYLSQYHHSQFHGMGGGNSTGGGGGGSGSHYSMTSNRSQPRKPWISWNQQNKKNYNNQKNIAQPIVSIGPTGDGSESSATSSSQTLPRSKTHQNVNNLRYVSMDTIKYSTSRSPTPSPKSESPILGEKLLQMSNTQSTDVSSGQDSLNPDDLQRNGYESDSSHSSYNPKLSSEYENHMQGMPLSAGAGGGFGQATEISSLLNFPTYIEDEHSSQIHYYGSQQNLSYWSPGYQSGYPTHAMYNGASTSTPGSGETNNPLINDSSNFGSYTLKRGQFNHRMASFRGRRNMYNSNVRTQWMEPFHTPIDRYLARAHLVEKKDCPAALLNGSKWDQLSQDIWNKFIGSQQTEETFKRKMLLWRYLYIIIKNIYPRYGLYLVGSTISGFGADTSDVDMCLVCRVMSPQSDQRMEALCNLKVVKDLLVNCGEFENFNLIEAKVPILRFRHKMHMLEVDLNYNNCVGINNTHLLYCYSQLDWRLRPLVLITKLWAQFHDINNAKNMTISSYSLVLMVIHFLQYAVNPPILPCLHEMFPEKFQNVVKNIDMNENIDPIESGNTQTIGELFLQFLEYYSNFDYTQYAISIRTGSLLPIEICRQANAIKNDIHQWKELCIEEPFDLTNTARSVYDGETFERVKNVFVNSWKVLQETMDLSSIFSSPIMNSPILSDHQLNTS